MRKMLFILLVMLLSTNCAFRDSRQLPPAPVTPFTTEAFDTLYSEKELGCTFEKGRFVFRIFAPRAKTVRLALFQSAKGPEHESYYLKRDDQGVWEISLKKKLWNSYYGYYIEAQSGQGDIFQPNILMPDPYSEALSTQNHYLINARTYIHKDEFDWGNDRWMAPVDPRDLIIYETHVRDMSAADGELIEEKGAYGAFIEKIPYLKKLGVNAVEFLPLHDFANIEIPYKDTSTALYNTWNPYERNHWGYMSTFFFAPENYYSSAGHMNENKIIEDKGKASEEFKSLVKALHNAGFAVIMDVVYNHTSTYDPNPFKMIDKKYYYRLNGDMEFTSVSGCGNDFKTERPMSRKMIVESVLYWMKEYHIDGFRFDLAAMIDDVTLESIRREARKLNTNVVLIAEPWGGTYNPDHFSDLDWSSWNDQFRNGIKGQNPHTRPGFIFGRWEDGVTRNNVMRFLMGSLRDDGGQYRKAEHSVNYLESHDDHTFGDFVRLAIGKNHDDDIIKDIYSHGKLTPEEMRYHKLGAFILGSSQGICMLHSGQEFARSKVIEINEVPDPDQGKIDHNSYNKDNSTNYINYNIAAQNKELSDFYASMLRLRQIYPQLRKAPRESLQPFYADAEYGIGYHILPSETYKEELLVLVNGSADKAALYHLPEGGWVPLISTHPCTNERVFRSVSLEPGCGLMLIRR